MIIKRRLKIDLMGSGRWVDVYAPAREEKQDEIWKETKFTEGPYSVKGEEW